MHNSRIKNAESAGENHMTVALMSVNFLVLKAIVKKSDFWGKLSFFSKSVLVGSV